MPVKYDQTTLRKNVNGTPIFLDDLFSKSRPQLEENISTDVLIIGGGLSGVSVAYNLALKGIDCVLVEQSRIGHGSTGRSTGIIVDSVEQDVADLKKTGNGIHYLFEERRSVDALLQIINQHNLNCDLETPGSLYIALQERNANRIVSEYEARQSEGDVSLLSPQQVKNYLKIDSFQGMHNKRGTMIQPLKFVEGLADLASSIGAKIYEKSGIKRLKKESKVAFTSRNNEIKYNKLVMAIASNVSELEDMIGKLILYQRCSAATYPLFPEQLAMLGWHGREMFWDACEPEYFYGRLTPDNRIIIGGEGRVISRSEFNKGAVNRDSSYRRLRYLFETNFPSLANIQFSHFWSGVVELAPDNYPMIGEVFPDHNVICSTMGLPFAYKSGEIMAGILDGKELTHSEFYNLHRNIESRRLFPIFLGTSLGASLANLYLRSKR